MRMAILKSAGVKRAGMGSRERQSPGSSTAPRPFLKWAGGKTAIYAHLRKFLTPISPGGTYFEPFLGGGAVFFALSPAKAVLSDRNKALIVAYQLVKDEPESLVRALSELGLPRGEAEYYRARSKFNRLLAKVGVLDREESVTFAAMFVWLNHLCFNGLYRVNRKGEFNVPYGFYQNPYIFDKGLLIEDSRALANATVACSDYEEALSSAQEGDLAYLDPPYDPISESSTFTSYTPTGFGFEEQERLARVVRELVGRGVRVVLSNSPSKRVRELYRGFRVEVVNAPRTINSVGSKRGPVEELVVVA